MTENIQGKTRSGTMKLPSVTIQPIVSPPKLSSSDSCLIKSILTLENKVDDGHIIKLIYPAWAEIIALIGKDSRIMHQISPRKWEEIIAGAYEKAGFDEVILTPQSGDLGRDVIAIKKVGVL